MKKLENVFSTILTQELKLIVKIQKQKAKVKKYVIKNTLSEEHYKVVVGSS